MRNIFFIVCLLLSISIFSQEKEVVKGDKSVPASIFATSSLDYQKSYGNMPSLRLTGHKFMLVDFNQGVSAIHSSRLNFDLRNFGRSFSFEDMTDNYSKAEFNKYNVTTNSDHFIWNIPFSRQQLHEQYKRNIKN